VDWWEGYKAYLTVVAVLVGCLAFVLAVLLVIGGTVRLAG